MPGRGGLIQCQGEHCTLIHGRLRVSGFLIGAARASSQHTMLMSRQSQMSQCHNVEVAIGGLSPIRRKLSKMDPEWSPGLENPPPCMPRPFPSLWDQSRSPNPPRRSRLRLGVHLFYQHKPGRCSACSIGRSLLPRFWSPEERLMSCSLRSAASPYRLWFFPPELQSM